MISLNLKKNIWRNTKNNAEVQFFVNFYIYYILGIVKVTFNISQE